ncbi:MAG: pyruvate formate lyase family protein [Thermoplasmatales archaeon]
MGPEISTPLIKKETELSERIQKLKNRVLSRPLEADFERVKWYTRVYKEMEGKPAGPSMRAALALQQTLRNMPIRIDDDELIVGSKSSKAWGDPLYIEDSSLLTELFIPLLYYKNESKVREVFPEGIGSLPPERLAELTRISEEEHRLLREEIFPYWKDKSTSALLKKRWEEEGLAGEPLGQTYRRVVVIDQSSEGGHLFGTTSRSTHDLLATVSPMQGHLIIGLRKVLQMGFKGIADQAKARLEEFKKDLEAGKIDRKTFEKHEDFLNAVQVSAISVCEFAQRYAKLAEEMAIKTNGQRKVELLEIAERCRQVPAEPPRNFMEALQAVWLTQVAILIAYGGGSITAPGRVDQYLYPYYKQDLEIGRITPEKALEAIMEYYIKLATVIYFGPNNVTIGGVDRNGENAVNDLSYFFLEAHKKLRGCGRNGLAVRIHLQKTPQDFLLKASEVHRFTAGISFYNDEVVISGLMADGYSLDDARDYGVVGCVEIAGAGFSNGYTSGQAVRLPSILEAALNEGCLKGAGWKRVGAPTPPASTFKTFEDVKKAFQEQLSYAIDLCVHKAYIKDQVKAENYPVPLLSATLEGCVESGKDMTWGGARINHGNVSAQSIATIANSLAAIKWVVFDKKLLTMEELVEHMRNNFEGAEEIRQILLRAPKYGNDDPYVDEIAEWVADVLSQETRKRKFWMGGVHRANLISVSGSQFYEGAIIGATPDGRLAHTPVSNGIAPTIGTERNGLTSVLRSAASACRPPLSDGTSLTLNLNPTAIKDDEGLEKFASMIEAYFALGGRQVQFNPISKEILLDAQKHPENYPDLVVKVTGYSWRFVDLAKPLQDDIIARMESDLT